MKTLIASIALLLLVLSGGILSINQLRKPMATHETATPQTESEPPTDEQNRKPEWNEELPDYYQVIIDNNLFRPLGWKPERKSDVPFQLVGTILSGTQDTAILKDVNSQQVHFVQLTEDIANGWHLVSIDPKQVILEKDGRQLTLGLSQQLFINPPPRR